MFLSCNSYQKTTSIIGGVTANITTKLGQMRHSESFRSIEEKVGSAYENVKVNLFLTEFCSIYKHFFFVYYLDQGGVSFELTTEFGWCVAIPFWFCSNKSHHSRGETSGVDDGGVNSLCLSLCVFVVRPTEKKCLHYLLITLYNMNYAMTNRWFLVSF